jgi:uncharacterized protein YbaA (DUF1428 family)
MVLVAICILPSNLKTNYTFFPLDTNKLE